MQSLNWIDKLDLLRQQFHVDPTSQEVVECKKSLKKSFSNKIKSYEKELVELTNKIHQFVVNLQKEHKPFWEEDYFDCQKDVVRLSAIDDLLAEREQVKLKNKVEIPNEYLLNLSLLTGFSELEIQKFLIEFNKSSEKSAYCHHAKKRDSHALLKKLENTRFFSKKEINALEKEYELLKTSLLFFDKELFTQQRLAHDILSKKIEKIEKRMHWWHLTKEKHYYLPTSEHKNLCSILNNILYLNTFVKNEEKIRQEIENHIFKLHKNLLEKEKTILKKENAEFHAKKIEENADLYHKKIADFQEQKIKWANFAAKEKSKLIKTYVDNIAKFRLENCHYDQAVPPSKSKWRELVTQKFALADDVYTEFTIMFGINSDNECELCARICSAFGSKLEFFTKNFQGIANPLPKTSAIKMADLKNPTNWIIADDQGQITFIFDQPH